MDDVNERKNLSPAQREEIRKQLSCSDIRPQPFDVTFSAWLHRLSLWGKVNIQYYDPDIKKKLKYTKDRFLDKVCDDNLIRMLGPWHIERIDFNRVEVYRTFPDFNGKNTKESFIIWIDLKPEIKKAAGNWWKFWNWGKQ